MILSYFVRNHARVLASNLAMSSHAKFPRYAVLSLVICLTSVARAQNTFSYLEDEAESGGFDITAQINKLPVEWSLAEQTNGDSYRLKITTNSVELSTLQNKKTTVLASEKTGVAPGAFIIQRRGVRWKVIAGNRLVLQAEDDKWQEGKIGFRGGEVKDAKLQPVEEITFDDDFMRIAKDVAITAATKSDPHNGVNIKNTKLDETIWKGLTGAWSTTGISENEAAMVAQSANPFAFAAKSKGANLAVAGRPFWSDYRFEAAVKPENSAAVGLAVYVQDAQNYLLFEWQQSGALAIKEVLAGQSKILASQKVDPYDDKNWYRLAFAVSGETLRVFIDDAEVLRARSELFGRGLAGLYVRNEADDSATSHTAVFDDIHIRSIDDFFDNFSEVVAGRWQPVSGVWKFQNAAMPADETGDYTVMGEGSWHEYSTSADINLPADGVAGLVVHHRKGEGAYVFRTAGSKAKVPYAGKAQIVKIGGGKSVTLSETETGNRFDGSKLRWSFGSERGYLQGRVEQDQKSVRILDAFDESLPAGRAGIYAQRGAGGIPALRNFQIEFPREKKTWSVVPDLYSISGQPETMGIWSTPEGLWLPAQPVKTSTPATPDIAGGDKTFWHKGAFWGDGDVRVKLPALPAGQNLILLFGNTSRTASNLPLKLTLSFDTGNLKASLTRGEEKLGEGLAKIEGEVKDKPLEVSRRGRFVIVRSGPAEMQSTLMVAKVS